MSNKTVIIFTIVAFVLGAIFYVLYPTPNEYQSPPDKKACTLEAMLCPDGSYVGRTGPNCEFVCPIPKDAVMEDGTI